MTHPTDIPSGDTPTVDQVISTLAQNTATIVAEANDSGFIDVRGMKFAMSWLVEQFPSILPILQGTHVAVPMEPTQRMIDAALGEWRLMGRFSDQQAMKDTLMAAIAAAQEGKDKL